MSDNSGSPFGEEPIDVPTMMQMLMAMYDNVRDDEVMVGFASLLRGAMVELDDLRAIAHQVMAEGDTAAQIPTRVYPDEDRKLC